MKIDLTALDYDELLELNEEVTKRLNYLDSIEAAQKMLSLTPGNTVSFEGRNGREIGTIIKLNQKTVVVLGASGRKWRVPVQLISPVHDARQSTEKSRVIDLEKRSKNQS